MHPPTPAQIERARAAVLTADGTGFAPTHEVRMKMHWRILRRARPMAEAPQGEIVALPNAVIQPSRPWWPPLPPFTPIGGDAA